MVNLRQQLKNLIQFPISLSLSGPYTTEGYIVDVKTDYIHFEDKNKIPMYIPIGSISSIKRNSKAMQFLPSNVTQVKQSLFKDFLTSMNQNWLYLKTANTDFLEGVLSSVYTDNIVFVHEENILIVPIYEIVSVQEIMDVEQDISTKMEQVEEQEAEVEQINEQEAEAEQINEQEAEAEQVNEQEAEVEQVNEQEAEVEQVNEQEAEVEQVNEQEAEAEQVNEQEAEVEQVNEQEAEVERVNEQTVEVEQKEETEEMVVESLETEAVEVLAIREKEASIQSTHQGYPFVEQDAPLIESVASETEIRESYVPEKVVASLFKEEDRDEIEVSSEECTELVISKKEHDVEMKESYSPEVEISDLYEEKYEARAVFPFVKSRKMAFSKKETNLRQPCDTNSRKTVYHTNDPKTRLLYIVHSRVMKY